ncbi:hypothetical protein FLL45_15170 [Aliikangiella marina]|uniref:Kinase n=1 Tax=Aliikangiella marina TaxID=1712262 RepID=A0A545T6J1_9GAMM|nr:hypothetical protein [Aliikangiella marina]TQV72808.1 hypothetical protein FLL45_15170 [Aliikangiella marina]
MAKRINANFNAKADKKPLIVGINAPQGAGKSTLCQLLRRVLTQAFELQVVAVSIDDFYLSRQSRLRLAETIHPLFKTRGVPGTHDISLAMNFFHRLVDNDNNQSIRVPCFDKATDNPAPEEKWEIHVGKIDIVLFEGWCVGANSINESDLIVPFNQLEADLDPDSTWRLYWNNRLANDYRQLFQVIDFLVYFNPPSWPQVKLWRAEQEANLRRRSSNNLKNPQIMNQQQLEHFMMHFERLTIACNEQMRVNADLIYYLDENRIPTQK